MTRDLINFPHPLERKKGKIMMDTRYAKQFGELCKKANLDDQMTKEFKEFLEYVIDLSFDTGFAKGEDTGFREAVNDYCDQDNLEDLEPEE